MKLIRLFKWIIENWRKITFHKVLNFLQAKYRETKSIFTEETTPDERQVAWRQQMVATLSPECLNGKCVKCGCETPDKFWESDACEEGCYPEWMNETEWIEFENSVTNT